MSRLKIAVDFDGTLCKHRYPEIGEELPKGIEFLKNLRELGVQVYLDTMRCGKELEEAIKWCKDRGLEFDSIGPHITQRRWTTSPKCHADYEIDDRSCFGDLISYDELDRPYVNWINLIQDFTARLKREGWL